MFGSENRGETLFFMSQYFDQTMTILISHFLRFGALKDFTDDCFVIRINKIIYSSSGVARAFPGGRGRNEEENEEKLRNNERSYRKMRKDGGNHQGGSHPHSPGWARVPLSSFFLKFLSINFIFPQIFLIFVLILALRVGDSPTREGPGYATGQRSFKIC